jgi:signal peptidase II
LKKKYLIFSATLAAVVLLDVITKAYVDSHMSLHQSVVVIGGFLNITYVRNPGAAFSFLAGASPGFRSVFFLAVTAIAIILVLYYVAKSKAEEPFMIFALSLILSGALGNFIDRVRLGEVIDFIDVHLRAYHWPAFNVADSAITVGAFIMLFALFKRPKEHENSP